jgi:hypothetical protein
MATGFEYGATATTPALAALSKVDQKARFLIFDGILLFDMSF